MLCLRDRLIESFGLGAREVVSRKRGRQAIELNADVLERHSTDPAEREALMRAGVRAFCLTNAQLRAEEQTKRFVENINRILQRARKRGPYIYGVYEGRLERLWPK